MDMRFLGKFVSKRPLTVVIIILIITAIFGYYTYQIQMSADLNTFLPNDEMSKALTTISNQFGSTDIMEIVIVSDNAVNKQSMIDMLTVKKAILEHSNIVENLKSPENPENSVMSPADVIVLGNITLSFEGDMKKNLYNATSLLDSLNLTPTNDMLNTMNIVLLDYKNIYNNATEIRNDAKTVVLLLFMQPQEGGGAMLPQVKSIMENVTATLMSTHDFEVKAKVLSLLTPPPQNASSPGNMTMDKNITALMNHFTGDMASNLSVADKEISLRYFMSTIDDFNMAAMNNSYTTLGMAINQSENLIEALNSTETAVSMGQNDTAIAILQGLLNQTDAQIKTMSVALPYYQSFNNTLATFWEKFHHGTLTSDDIEMLKNATSNLIPFTRGDEREIFTMFLNTLNTWEKHRQIYYDLQYQSNVTAMICSGFIQNYQGTVMLNNSLADLESKINHQPTIYTIAQIDMMKNMLSQQINEMSNEKNNIKEAMEAFSSSTYLQWFLSILGDLDYVLLNAPNTGVFAINIFNTEMEMMNSSPVPGGTSTASFQVFYALKHAFESPVSDVYKEKIENMFLTEMNFASSSMPEMNFTMPDFSIKMPNFNPTVDEEMNIIENMSDSQITDTIANIENYNPEEFLSIVNSTIPVVQSSEEKFNYTNGILSNLIENMNFVYKTTQNQSVLDSIPMYTNISYMLENASSGLSYFSSYLPRMGGFTTMMSQLSSQLTSMFSNDFTGTTAKAAMMVVMLNSTYKPGESTVEHSKRMERLEEMVENVALHTKVHGKVMVLGPALISKATEKTANETMNVLLPVSVILIIIILAITVRSIIDTLLGLLGLGMAIIWAYGFGVIANYNFNQVVTTVAVLLVGLGIDYAIHTILRYREELKKGKKVRKAMEEMITHLGMGLVLATITTIIAFLSNISSPIPPVADFGVMNAVGIFGAFIIFTTFVPGIKILIDCHREKKGTLKIRKEKERVGSGVVLLNKAMSMGAVGAEKHRHIVLSLIIIVTLIAGYAGMHIGTTFDVKDFLPSNLEISDTLTFMMDNFNASGLNDNYVLVEGNITSAQALKAVDKTMDNMKDDSYVDYAQCESITTIIREMEEKNTTFAHIVAGNDTDGDGLPDKNIVPIFNWLYEHSEDAKSILNKTTEGRYNMMLITVRSHASSDKEYRILTKELQEDIIPLKNAGLEAVPTGSDLLTYHVMDLLENTEWNSLVITLIASFVVLTAIFMVEERSIVLGTITSLPVLIALLWILGTMYAMNLNFNVITVTITSLTIGLGITYAIHITHRFLEDWRKEKNITEALKVTLRHTGTSVFGAATTTMAGFGTLSLSSMPPIRQFGIISAISILYSFLLSVFILPTFLYYWAAWKEKKQKNK